MLDHGDNFSIGGFNTANMLAAQQGGHLAGMINQVNDAISAENESRVAQEREARRMQHEQEMAQMALQAQAQQAQRQEELLQRLQQQRMQGGVQSPYYTRLTIDDAGHPTYS